MSTFTKNAAKAILGTLIAGTAIMSTAGAANAHATAQTYGSTPTANGYGQLFVRIPHGCEGEATDTVKVQIPVGFTAVKPQAKSGWTVSTVKADGKNVSEVTWSGGNLLDSQFDDFGLSVKFPAAGTYYMPVVQLCGTKTSEWTQIPAAGEDSHSLDHPAPAVKVAEAAEHGHSSESSRWTGDVEVTLKKDKATITVDASSIHRGKVATVRVSGHDGDKTVFKARLDRAGDIQRNVKAKARYEIKNGSTVEVLVNGKVIASTTVGK